MEEGHGTSLDLSCLDAAAPKLDLNRRMDTVLLGHIDSPVMRPPRKQDYVLLCMLSTHGVNRKRTSRRQSGGVLEGHEKGCALRGTNGISKKHLARAQEFALMNDTISRNSVPRCLLKTIREKSIDMMRIPFYLS